MMNPPLSPRDWELLSAYLDGQLTAAEHRQAQDLLARRADLRQGLTELEHTRSVLRAAPRRRAPRNFTLTPAIAHRTRRQFHWGWAPSFSLASGMAVVLFVLSFFFRLSPAGLPAAAPMAAPAAATSQSVSGLQEKDLAQNPASPPMIIWNDIGRGGAPADAAGGLGGAPASAPSSGETIPTPSKPTTAELSPTLSAAGETTPTPGVKSMAPPRATLATPQENLASTSSNGPILGVAPAEERGQTVPDTQVVANQARPALPGAAVPPAQAPIEWAWVQVGLAGLALVSGLAAFIVWWRSRR